MPGVLLLTMLFEVSGSYSYRLFQPCNSLNPVTLREQVKLSQDSRRSVTSTTRDSRKLKKRESWYLGEGSLIFDEVKVTAKLQWNSRDNSLVGYAMTGDEMASMNDVYQYLDKDECVPKTDYVMQTMWRDHSSNCDIIGPYYTSSGSMTASFTLSCVMDAMRKFHAYGFKVF